MSGLELTPGDLAVTRDRIEARHLKRAGLHLKAGRIAAAERALAEGARDLADFDEQQVAS